MLTPRCEFIRKLLKTEMYFKIWFYDTAFIARYILFYFWFFKIFYSNWKKCFPYFQVYQQCKLKNILELWRTLAVARARFLLHNNEVFFYYFILLWTLLTCNLLNNRFANFFYFVYICNLVNWTPFVFFISIVLRILLITFRSVLGVKCRRKW